MMKRNKFWILLLSIGFYDLSISREINVPFDFTSIQKALSQAETGDTIIVSPGEYIILESLDFNKNHDPDDPKSPQVKNVTLKSEEGAEQTIIRLSDTPISEIRRSVFVFESGETNASVLDGFTLTGGKGIRDYYSEDNLNYWLIEGGGIYIISSSPIIKNCIIKENDLTYIPDNAQDKCIYSGGGVFCKYDENAIIENCIISNNLSGGGLVVSGYTEALIENCIIRNNKGGGVGFGDISGPSDPIIFKASAPKFKNCIVNENYEGSGFSIFGKTKGTIEGCVIQNNIPLNPGAGIFIYGCCFESIPTISHCLIKENHGGGITCIRSSPKIQNCRVEGNDYQAITIDIYSEPEIDRSIIIGNTNGVLCHMSGHTEIRNCLFTGNYASHLKVQMCENNINVTNCTFTGDFSYNLPGYHGGIYCEGGSSQILLLKNCIIWRILEDDICGELDHCLVNIDPFFEEPGLFEDKTITRSINGEEYAFPDYIAIEPILSIENGSPAIDSGTWNGAPEVDIDGFGRPCGEGIDIGAYEFGNCEPLNHFLRGDANGDGRYNLADAIRILCYMFEDNEDLMCLDAADTNDDGQINLADALKLLSYLFAAGESLPEPFMDCGIDPNVDDLDCASFSLCE